MAGIQQEERIERLKALLVGESRSRRAGAALSSAPDRSKNLMLGVLLHGANRLREGFELTDLEQVLVDALSTIVDTEEVKAWGGAYRETVAAAGADKLILPLLITLRWPRYGYSFNDLRSQLPKLRQEAWEAPNVSLVPWEDLVSGRVEEDEAFVEAMRETGFAITGIARYSSPSSSASSEDALGAQAEVAALEPWRVKLEMESFYVEREVGDQWNSRDEIYFAASSGVGGGVGETFISEEFGAVEKGQTREFSSSRKVFLNKMCSSGTVLTGIQVWEADQSNSAWYDKLQLALESTVEMVDEYVDKNPMNNLVPVPDTVAIGWEIAKLFIALMDTLRNHDDLSCSRTFILTREDMTALHGGRELEWNFNGDGHHKLRVRYTGERPPYPTGSVYCTFRDQDGSSGQGGEWSTPMPLGGRAQGAPRAAVHDGKLHVVYANAHQQGLMTSGWYDGTGWKAPTSTGRSTPQPVGLAVWNQKLWSHWYVPVGPCLWGTSWDSDHWHNYTFQLTELDTRFGSGLAERNGRLWVARSSHRQRTEGNALVLCGSTEDDGGHFGDEKELATSSHAFGTVSMAYGLDRMWVTARQDRQVRTYWSARGQSPDTAQWQSEAGPQAGSSNNPALHFDGQNLWCAYTDTSGKPHLSRRVNETSTSAGSWSTPVPIGDGTHPTVLDAPGIATYKGRMYAFYHA
ncbi:hypothetical protein [Streptomyces natalensis]|uniref:Fucose-specific lectin n=1 Tax=Streptomyces natalensis ATCC 27448 TaxID=1240678 RepID=A0A0D7CRI2_9ACTN|nr:hypothetical protein [Streptomyces natalensis]KIZ18470.1 hypothetical protein SNA_07615 [Streptomyces natalensis ATCC 27448]